MNIEFFKQVQHNGNYLLIVINEGEFINLFYYHNFKSLEILIIKESIIEYKEEYAIEDNNKQEVYDQNLNHLNNILDKMIADIETLKNRHTIPRTFKDFNRNILYWN
ncbi:hypothetical protein F8M41_009228 [Gigaspora margarita]|uniref:Uncharacterized protein n=1 Tax=Gigaspora margarita TaxID=4874 RepID=A0A8H3X2C6_GIGMA|nr:hypothetical protein F8M41_009228 [Gigaspora margarita]